MDFVHYILIRFIDADRDPVNAEQVVMHRLDDANPTPWLGFVGSRFIHC